jgi:acetyl-CoA carboxylase carboxyltransferase component
MTARNCGRRNLRERVKYLLDPAIAGDDNTNASHDGKSGSCPTAHVVPGLGDVAIRLIATHVKLVIGGIDAIADLLLDDR